MRMWKRILCPIDFSASSKGASRLALRLAAKGGGAVTLAHVVEPMYWTPDLGFGGGDTFGAIDRAVDEGLAAYRRDASARFPGVAVSAVRLTGVPWRRIADLAALEEYDLIAIGMRGRTGIKHLLGSVAERVVRHATCPVLVVRGAQREDQPLFNAILCPVDFSEPSRKAMRAAAELAVAVGASLTLQHVYEVPAYVAPPATLPAIVEGEKSRTRSSLSDWQVEAKALGAEDVRIVWCEGTAWHEITRRAADHGHDLIVLGTHGRTGLSHALIGSVAERVVRHAGCPVLTIRA